MLAIKRSRAIHVSSLNVRHNSVTGSDSQPTSSLHPADWLLAECALQSVPYTRTATVSAFWSNLPLLPFTLKMEVIWPSETLTSVSRLFYHL
jgi:hypothetical protein